MWHPCHVTYAKLDKYAFRAHRSLSSLVKNHYFYTPSIFIVICLPYHIISKWYKDTFAALLQCGLKLSAQACVIYVKDLEAFSWRHRNCCLSVGTNCWKAVQTSSSMISSCDFRMTKSSFCLKIVARRSIRLVAKALHPFPGEGFNSNGASLGTWRLR